MILEKVLKRSEGGILKRNEEVNGLWLSFANAPMEFTKYIIVMLVKNFKTVSHSDFLMKVLKLEQ